MSIAEALGRIQSIQSRVTSLAPPAARASAPSGSASFDATLQSQLTGQPAGAGAPGGVAGAAGAPGAATATATNGAYGLGEPSPYDAQILQVARETGVPPALIKAVAKAESDFNPNTTSSAGAQGLMQLMPVNQQEQGVTDPFDPLQSLRGGAKELAGYMKLHGGNLELVLASYNAGPNAVKRYGGIPPYAETQAYVQKVQASWRARS